MDLAQELMERHFTLRKVNEEEKSYMFTNEYIDQQIVLEIFSNGSYHFYWTKMGMLGFMDSGLILNIGDLKSFEYNYTLFKMQVEAIKGKTIHDMF